MSLFKALPDHSSGQNKGLDLLTSKALIHMQMEHSYLLISHSKTILRSTQVLRN